MSLLNSILAFFGRKTSKTTNAPIKDSPKVPVTVPATASRPKFRDTIPQPYGLWAETGPMSNYGYPVGKLLWCHRTTKVPGAFNVRIIHPLYAPIYGKAFAQSAGFVAQEIGAAKAQHWSAVAIDAENQFWDLTALKWIYDKARANGVLCYLVPKATLDPGGKKLHPDFAYVARFLHDHSDGLMLWAYGDHKTHIAARERLLSHGYGKEIALVHDAFRFDTNKGYIGRKEGPKLAAWCKKNGVPFVLFQPKNHSPAQIQETW